jgi:hypothetical protein
MPGRIGDGNLGELETPSLKLSEDPNSVEFKTLWR